jgi:hypothetical protein
MCALFEKFNDMDKIIKETKHPLTILYIVLCNNNITSQQKCIVVKLFFKYHINIALEYNLLILSEISENSMPSYYLMKDIYNIIIIQLRMKDLLLKFKSMYKNKFFWKIEIKEQIVFLKNLYTIFLSIFDGSKSTFYFHLKLKNITYPNSYHIHEIECRLRKLYNLLKKPFFTENNILLLNNEDFYDLKFENMVRYTEYIFNKINSLICKYIGYFELYENYREQFENIISISNMLDIDIDISDFDSDIDTCDINSIIQN